MDYHYPIDETWSKQEIIDVVNFFSMVEKAYENSVDCEDFMITYRRFKQIVPAKSEEKKCFSTFEKASGYSSFQVVKQASIQKSGKLKVTKGSSNY